MKVGIDAAHLEESDSVIEYSRKGARSSSEDLGVPKKMSVLVCFIGASLFWGFSYLCHVFLITPKMMAVSSDEMLEILVARVLLCVLLGVSIWFSVYLVVAYLMIVVDRRSEKQTLLRTIFLKNGIFACIILTFLILALVTNIYDRMIEARIKIINFKKQETAIEAERKELESSSSLSGTISGFLTGNISRVFVAISVFLGMFLLKNIFTAALNFKMFFKNYESRIQKNNEDFKILDIINKVTGTRMHQDTDKWVAFLFDTMASGSSTLSRRTLEYLFGVNDSKRILDRLEIWAEAESGLTRERLLNFYTEVLNEGRRIGAGMAQKLSIVDNLDRIISTFLVPIGFLLCSSIVCEKIIGIMSSMPFQLSTIASFTFVFSPILSEAVRASVYVLFVAQFDVGDRLYIDGVCHEVYDIGILYSSFKVRKKVVAIQNIKIMEKQIVNLRQSKVHKRTFNFRFTNCFKFKERLNALRAAIKKEVDSSPEVYVGSFSVCDYELRKRNGIRVSIEMLFKLRDQNIALLREKEDAFVMFLSGIFRELDLVIGYG